VSDENTLPVTSKRCSNAGCSATATSWVFVGGDHTPPQGGPMARCSPCTKEMWEWVVAMGCADRVNWVQCPIDQRHPFQTKEDSK